MSERQREQQPSDSLIVRGNDSSQRSLNQQPPPPPAAPHAPSTAEQHGPRTTAGTSSAASPALHRYPGNNGRSMDLPPLQQQVPSGQVATYQPSSRSVGVSSILNPVDSDDSSQSRRRKAPHLHSSPSSSNVLPPLGLSNRPPPSATSTPTPSAMSITAGYGVATYGADRPPRRILTPRSPSVHRASSLSQLNASSAPIFSAQHAPFAGSPRSRTYMVEPGTGGAPPLPHLPPSARHSSYGSSAPIDPQPHAPGGRNVDAHSRARPPSQSESPRSSYSSASPATTYGQSSMPTLSASYSAGQDYGGGHAVDNHGGEHQRAVGVPVSSSSAGQNVYQMMTLETTSGTVSLPVDVQAASRVADEKRRRNAGASARFRQRRKEKEKEASTTISRLEQQLKELGEDMEFYKRERDYMAGVILQVPGGDRHFPRPQSPRHRRSSGYSGPSASSSYMQYQEPGARSPDSGRNVRRRTSTLSLPHFPAPSQGTHTAPGPPLAQTYPPPNYGQQIAPQPHLGLQQASHPLPSPMTRGTLPAPPPPPPPAGSHGPPQVMQAAPQGGPWNPYADRRGPQHQLHEQHRQHQHGDHA